MKYKIIVDKQPKENPTSELKEYEIDIEELRYKDNVYDELVITKDEDYIIRRLELSPYFVLKKLNTPKKEVLTDINIELFEGENYVYVLDMAGSKIYAEYLIKNEFNDLYVTETQMHSAIEQSAEAINLEVKQKVGKDEIIAKINTAIENGQGIIVISGNKVIINSDYFNLDAEGHIKATAGIIGGFDLGETEFVGNLSGIYHYNKFDLIIVMSYILGLIAQDFNVFDIYDIDNSNSILPADYVSIKNIIQQNLENTKTVNGKLVINSKNPKHNLSVYKDNKLIASIGVGGMNAVLMACDNFICGDSNTNTYVTINGSTGEMAFTKRENGSTSAQTFVRPDYVQTPVLTQTSERKQKKNISKLKNALDIIKNVDIYKYNLKKEKKGTKKHIGFVIGDKYNYAKELTNNENTGAEIYSLASVCLAGIKEQQEQIEALKKEIEQLKEA